MAISAADVKTLREATGLGMMECKKALEDSGGDQEKAVDILRTASRRQLWDDTDQTQTRD